MNKKIKYTFVIIVIILTPLFYSIIGSFETKLGNKSPISFIATVCKSIDQLPTDFFSEVLGLSKDMPCSVCLMSANKKLSTLPFIQEIKVTRYSPSTLKIDYALRKPFFSVGDYENTLMDTEGYLFPQSPFYTPKKLPVIHLGPDLELSRTMCIDSYVRIITKKIYGIFDKSVKSLVFTNASPRQKGFEELVVILETNKGNIHKLRIPIDDYEQALNDYSRLCEKIEDCDYIIDLRLKNHAYISMDHSFNT